MEKTAQEEKNLEAFKAGALEAHKTHNLDTEYASNFRANVHGDEFENEEQARTNGIEAVENTLEDMYMNPQTGSVDTMANWETDQRAEGWDIDDLKTLVKVVNDDSVNWI